MTNQYVPNLQDLLPGELARSSDINNRYAYMVSGFDKLPAPLVTGQGFSDPVPVGTPTSDEHAVTKIFAETTLINAAEVAALAHITPTLNTHLSDTTALQQQAASSETAAAASEAAAATSQAQAFGHAADAQQSASQADSNYQSLRDRFLGPKVSAPSVDDDGDALLDGAVYYNTTNNRSYVRFNNFWKEMATPLTVASTRLQYTATAGQTAFDVDYYPGEIDVFLNGIKLFAGTDFTATTGTSITLSSGAAAGDSVDLVGFQSMEVADTMTSQEIQQFIANEFESLAANSAAIEDAIGDSALLDLGI